jgi:hypothetical protein
LAVTSPAIHTMDFKILKILGVLFFGKSFLPLGGKGGFYLTWDSKRSRHMISFTLNSYKDFGIGIRFYTRELSNYSVVKVEMDLLILKVSFAFTKYNA